MNPFISLPAELELYLLNFLHSVDRKSLLNLSSTCNELRTQVMPVVCRHLKLYVPFEDDCCEFLNRIGHLVASVQICTPINCADTADSRNKLKSQLRKLPEFPRAVSLTVEHSCYKSRTFPLGTMRNKFPNITQFNLHGYSIIRDPFNFSPLLPLQIWENLSLLEYIGGMSHKVLTENNPHISKYRYQTLQSFYARSLDIPNHTMCHLMAHASNLSELCLNLYPWSDDMISSLSNFHHLKTLNLKCRAEEQGISAIFDAIRVIPGLKHLFLVAVDSNFKTEPAKWFGKACYQLETLHLESFYRIEGTQEFFPILTQLQSEIRTLSMKNYSFYDQNGYDVLEFVCCSRLKILHIDYSDPHYSCCYNCYYIVIDQNRALLDRWVSSLASIPRLRYLYVGRQRGRPSEEMKTMLTNHLNPRCFLRFAANPVENEKRTILQINDCRFLNKHVGLFPN